MYYVAYYSALNFTLSIEQPSSMVTKFGIMRYWRLNVKPNLGCCSNITRTISYISVFGFISIIPRLMELWPFKCQCHPVSLWRWPLIGDLEKCYLLRSASGMYYLHVEGRLRYLHLLPRYCPCNLLPEPTSPEHQYIGQLWCHPVTSSLTTSLWKILFCIIWYGLFISEVQLKLCVILQNFQSGRKLNMPARQPWVFPIFSILIDAQAEILKGIYQFYNLTYFVTWWPWKMLLFHL